MAAWLLDEVSEIDFRIEYIPGNENTLADAFSRFPLVGPLVLLTKGLLETFRVMLEVLPDSYRHIDHLWIHAAKFTTEVARVIRE